MRSKTCRQPPSLPAHAALRLSWEVTRPFPHISNLRSYSVGAAHLIGTAVVVAPRRLVVCAGAALLAVAIRPAPTTVVVVVVVVAIA